MIGEMDHAFKELFRLNAGFQLGTPYARCKILLTRGNWKGPATDGIEKDDVVGGWREDDHLFVQFRKAERTWQHPEPHRPVLEHPVLYSHATVCEDPRRV